MSDTLGGEVELEAVEVTSCQSQHYSSGESTPTTTLHHSQPSHSPDIQSDAKYQNDQADDSKNNDQVDGKEIVTLSKNHLKALFELITRVNDFTQSISPRPKSDATLKTDWSDGSLNDLERIISPDHQDESRHKLNANSETTDKNSNTTGYSSNYKSGNVTPRQVSARSARHELVDEKRRQWAAEREELDTFERQYPFGPNHLPPQPAIDRTTSHLDIYTSLGLQAPPSRSLASQPVMVVLPSPLPQPSELATRGGSYHDIRLVRSPSSHHHSGLCDLHSQFLGTSIASASTRNFERCTTYNGSQHNNGANLAQSVSMNDLHIPFQTSVSAQPSAVGNFRRFHHQSTSNGLNMFGMGAAMDLKRLKALEYQRELDAQRAEKQRRKREEEERVRREEEALERRIREQQEKLRLEFEADQRKLKERQEIAERKRAAVAEAIQNTPALRRVGAAGLSSNGLTNMISNTSGNYADVVNGNHSNERVKSSKSMSNLSSSSATSRVDVGPLKDEVIVATDSEIMSVDSRSSDSAQSVRKQSSGERRKSCANLQEISVQTSDTEDGNKNSLPDNVERAFQRRENSTQTEMSLIRKWYRCLQRSGEVEITTDDEQEAGEAKNDADEAKHCKDAEEEVFDVLSASSTTRATHFTQQLASRLASVSTMGTQMRNGRLGPPNTNRKLHVGPKVKNASLGAATRKRVPSQKGASVTRSLSKGRISELASNKSQISNGCDNGQSELHTVQSKVLHDHENDDQKERKSVKMEIPFREGRQVARVDFEAQRTNDKIIGGHINGLGLMPLRNAHVPHYNHVPHAYQQKNAYQVPSQRRSSQCSYQSLHDHGMQMNHNSQLHTLGRINEALIRKSASIDECLSSTASSSGRSTHLKGYVASQANGRASVFSESKSLANMPTERRMSLSDLKARLAQQVLCQLTPQEVQAISQNGCEVDEQGRIVTIINKDLTSENEVEDERHGQRRTQDELATMSDSAGSGRTNCTPEPVASRNEENDVRRRSQPTSSHMSQSRKSRYDSEELHHQYQPLTLPKVFSHSHLMQQSQQAQIGAKQGGVRRQKKQNSLPSSSSATGSTSASSSCGRSSGARATTSKQHSNEASQGGRYDGKKWHSQELYHRT